MKYLAIPAAALLVTIGVPAAALAAPTQPSAQRVALVNDCGMSTTNGSCTSLDNLGSYAGTVKYRQKAKGDLRLVFNIKSAPQNTAYDLELYCGAQTGTLVGKLADAMHTSDAGAVKAGPFEMSLDELQKACGKGAVAAHVLLADATRTSVLSASPIQLHL